MKRKIIAPDSICLYKEESAEPTMVFLNEIDKFIQNPKLTTIDFSNCKNISAAAALMTFAKITRCQIIADEISSLGHQSIKITPPEDNQIKKLFKSSGMFNAIKPGGLKKLENLWDDNENPFKTSNNSKNIGDIPNHLEKTLGNVPKRLFSALSESQLNINHHAYEETIHPLMKGRWWQYIKHNKANKTISVVIYDMGRGIPTTIKNKYFSESVSTHATDNTLIEYAMTSGKTRHLNGQGRGNGFTNIKNPMDLNESAKYLLVCSGKGIVKYKDQRVISSEVSANYSFSGTLIEWNFEESKA